MDKENPQPLRDLLHRAAIKETENWVSAQYLSARSIGRGGPDLQEGLDKAEKRARDAIKALAAYAAAPQVVADEPTMINGRFYYTAEQMRAALAAAPVQAQEPVYQVSQPFPADPANTWRDASSDAYDMSHPDRRRILYRAPVQPVAVPDSTIVLSGHQLRMALDLINPGGPIERDELDDQLSFGIRQHCDDHGKASTDMCCWNGDTDGVLPLNGEYEAPVAPAAQGDAKEAFQHTGGRLYEKLGELKAKVGDTGWWNAVRYRSIEDGQEYVTDSDRWHHSFTAIAAKAAS